MDNHYHLLVDTPEGNLSRGMRQLNGVYTQKHNRRHDRAGHVFQGRYKAILVEKESYLLELARYIVLNPVRARMVHTPVEWLWSSCRATVGLEAPPAGVHVDWILAPFGDERGNAIDEYKELVANGKGLPSPWQELKNQIYMGSEQFVADMQQEIDLALSCESTSTSITTVVPLRLDGGRSRIGRSCRLMGVAATPCKQSESTLTCTIPGKAGLSAGQKERPVPQLPIYLYPTGEDAPNAYMERFNRTARHEWLDLHEFNSEAHAWLLATQWLWQYNNERPNSAIGGVPPAQLLKAN